MKTHLVFLFLFTTYISFAQEEIFLVLHIDGKISYSTNEIPLKVDDEFRGNPAFVFSSSHDRAILWSSKRNELCLYPKEAQTRTNESIGHRLLKNLQPIKEYLGTRGDEDSFSYLFIKNSRLLFPMKIKVFHRPKTSNSYYFLQFRYKEKLLLKKLEINEKSIVTIDNAILTVENENINSTLLSSPEIGFYDHSSYSKKMLSGIRYVFVDLNKTEKVLQKVKVNLKNQNKDATFINGKLKAFIKDIYGSQIDLKNFDLD